MEYEQNTIENFRAMAKEACGRSWFKEDRPYQTVEEKVADYTLEEKRAVSPVLGGHAVYSALIYLKDAYQQLKAKKEESPVQDTLDSRLAGAYKVSCK